MKHADKKKRVVKCVIDFLKVLVFVPSLHIEAISAMKKTDVNCDRNGNHIMALNSCFITCHPNFL